MAPAFKITYFNGRGLAEPLRYLLKYGGIEFEDVRIENKEWSQFKDETPFGQLPVLDHNGKEIGQSGSIARYLAKLVKLAGKDDWEDLEIDAIVETINDLRLRHRPIFLEKDEGKKKEQQETYIKETLPYTLSRLEAIAQRNKGHLACDRLTWADFYFATISTFFDVATGIDVLADYPNLRVVRDTVNEIPAIKGWIEVRPKTEH